MPERPSAWPAGAEDAIGQAGEFLVWTALITQSGGDLHVFLPLLDRGIDGLIHRLHDGAYLTIQVKAKSAVSHREAPFGVYERHLFTPDQLVVGVLLVEGHLGPYTLVADAATIQRKAARIDDRGRTLLVVDMPVTPAPGHKWAEDLVETVQLAARLGVPARQGVPPEAPPVAPPLAAPSDEDHLIGFIGEQEVCRRLATLADCGLFRPFPDSEIVEVAVRRLATGATLGIQVKTAQLDDRHAMRHVLIHRASFVAAPSTYIVALAWIVPEGRFHESCLVLPSLEIPRLASADGPYYELHFRADGSREASRLDPYRVPLEELADQFSIRL